VGFQKLNTVRCHFPQRDELPKLSHWDRILAVYFTLVKSGIPNVNLYVPIFHNKISCQNMVPGTQFGTPRYCKSAAVVRIFRVSSHSRPLNSSCGFRWYYLRYSSLFVKYFDAHVVLLN